jgi:hypothetical protein
VPLLKGKKQTKIVNNIHFRDVVYIIDLYNISKMYIFLFHFQRPAVLDSWQGPRSSTLLPAGVGGPLPQLLYSRFLF